MKAERRHELRENDLAHWVGETVSYARDSAPRLILLVGGVVVVAVLAWVLVHNRSQALTDGWARYNELIQVANLSELEDTLADLQSIAAETPDDTLAMLALGRCGHNALMLAAAAEDPSDLARFNDVAKAALTSLRERFAEYPLARGVALCGLATVAENEFVAAGDVSAKETARTLLAAVRDDPDLNGTPLKEQAINRLNTLDQVFVAVDFAPPAPLPELPPAGPPAEDANAPDGASETADAPAKSDTTSGAAEDASGGAPAESSDQDGAATKDESTGDDGKAADNSGGGDGDTPVADDSKPPSDDSGSGGAPSGDSSGASKDDGAGAPKDGSAGSGG